MISYLGLGLIVTVKHNKKRNVGLIFEFLSRFLAEKTLSGDHAAIQKAKKIISKNFHKDSSLRKELSLFQALFESTFTNELSAQRFLETVREKNSKLSTEELEKEKSLLLQEVNISFPNSIKTIFEAEIPNYKDYATIQVLLNEWRAAATKSSSSTTVVTEGIINSELALIEDRVLSRLLTEKAKSVSNNGVLQVSPQVSQHQESTTDSKLVLHLMIKEVNKKYGAELNESQLEVINLYSLNKQEELATKLSEIHNKISNLLTETVNNSEVSKEIRDKCSELRVQMNENVTTLNEEELITFYLELTELEKDLATNK